MRNKDVWVSVILCLIAIGVETAWADTIRLKNGNRLNGRIVSVGQHMIIVELSGMGRLRLSRDEVASFERATDTPQVPDPSIERITPTSGAAGSTVTIYGSGFSVEELDAIRVTFNSVSARVTDATPVAIGVLVPEGATSGPVQIFVNERPSNTAPFLVDSSLVVRGITSEDHHAGFMLGELIVRYKQGQLTEPELSAINAQYGIASQQYHPSEKAEFSYYLVRLAESSRENTERVQQLLLTDPRVASATPNLIFTIPEPIGDSH